VRKLIGLRLGLARFLHTPATAQCLGNHLPRGGLRGGITRRERQRLAPHVLGLREIILREAQLAHFNPQQRIVGLDAQRPLQRFRRDGVVAGRSLRSRLRDQ
jgi:hypothetical protein